MRNLFLKSFVSLLILFYSSITYADRIRDLTTIQGLQEKKLIGYGLIIGLNGTGDELNQSPLTSQAITNMLFKLGIATSNESNTRLKNTASVIVTATLPPFIHKGQKIDILVSSLGNAKSINKGRLLMTSLKGNDNITYALAQGQVSCNETDDLEAKNVFLRPFQNMNGGTIRQGAVIDVESNTNFGDNGIIDLQLNEEDFSLSQNISDSINIKYPDTAIPLDSRTVQLSTPENRAAQIRMLSNIQNIDINIPIQDAKIVINSKTGSIVINHDVTLGNCAISHGNFSIVIEKDELLLHKNKNVTNNQTWQSPEENNESIPDNQTIKRNQKNNLNNIIRALNSLGAKPYELILILQSMKDAGCLHAKLEIIS
ncbi:Flagellar P-ring protein [Buchnera aphidicola (Eriosoma grossulariae)]|uniref:flagellar basal body P-ring protein FlgI n=1 Tax=Buchnera aphidicola TaxID=9 RepID=UPI0034648C97